MTRQTRNGYLVIFVWSDRIIFDIIKLMLIIDEKIIQLDGLADQVVSTFMTLDVVTDFKAKQAAFASDTEVQKQLQTLEENKAFINFRPELRTLQRDVLMTDSIYQLKIAENDIQTALSALARKLAGVISDSIEVDENLPFKKGGHHGRHHH